MWCVVNGCGVVWMWCVCEVRGVGGVMSGKCVVSAVCVRCTACELRVAWRCERCVWLSVCVVYGWHTWKNGW